MDQGASLDSADQGSEEAGGPEKILRAATVALEVEGTHKGLQPIRGTGFIIAPGVVATCAHLFDGASSNVRGRTSHGRQIHLQVSQEAPRKESRDLDLVFLTGIDGESIALDYVLMDPYIDIGDRLWTFGHPANGYQRGQSANFTYQGGSRPDGTPDVELGRVFGTPVGPGYSGSAVLNLATGAVCGMLLTSDERGSAHMLPASEIIAAAGIYLGSLTSRSNLPWIESLSDEQLERGRWQYPPTSLRRYINSLKRYSDTHPYSFTPGPNRRPLPALSSVYVRQVAAAQTRPTSTGANRVMAADDLLHIDDDLCVTGPAGYGKSSLLRAVTRELAELPFTDVTKVPSCVMATDLVARQTVADALASSINAELSAYGLISPVSADVFSRPPWSGARWLILVDGLDEVASSTSRDAILKKLRALAESSPDVYQFMIATRPLEHEMASVQFYEALQIYELLPFNGEQVVTLAQSWLKALGAPDIDESTRRFEDAITMVGLGDLAQNPLMATMLLQLFLLDESKALPPGRYLVYQEYLATLRAQLFESSGRGLREQLLQTLRPFGSSAENAAEEILREADGWLCQLAYSRQRGISDQADLLLNEWTAALRPSTVPADLWKSMLREVLRRSGILVEHVEDFYFLHQTIQEFLAAQYAFSVSGLAEEEILEAISAERADVNGSNVVRQESYLRFLLAAALPYDNGVLNAIIDALMEDRFDVCDLVVTLASDGVVINERLAEETIRALSRLATSPSASISTIRAALDSIVKISDSSRAFFTFLDIVDDHAAPSKARELAIDALGEYCVDTGAGFPGRWRSLRALAETREPHTLDVLVRICKDSRFDGRDRVQAFEALVHIEDIARVKELVYLTVDDRLFAWQREHIASVLRTLPGVSLSYRQRVRVLWIGLRGRLSRFKARWQSTLVAEELVPLISEHRKWHPRADIRLLQQAYETADRWHSGQYRKSGDPYITHPLAVAGVLAGLGMDTTTLVAALLQDVAEDTAYTLDQVRADFGESVALLVDCATKFRKVRLRDTAKAEAIRKMVVATAKDPRVPVIVLADRLHNMRTLTYLSAISRERAAKETLEILAPLAHRLGMNTIKWELEDLAFEQLFPKRFHEIKRLIDEHQPQREALLRQVTNKVQGDLRTSKIKAEVTGRPKHLYSVYQKMIARGLDFNDIYDLVGVRILVETVRDCYAALGVIHANWQPVPGRFKDYIAMPKFNMYQSLHTTVIGPTGKPVEMQIRTNAMHRTAEYGIAAHWKYKENKAATIVGPPAHIDEMTWLRQLLDWQREASDPSEFLDALRFDLSSQEVYVFTPKGDVRALPVGSTPVDFAYAVHTDVGHRCIGARVNSKLVPLESVLSNGDVVEIFTSKSEKAHPTQDWLGFVKSPRARTKIRQYFKKERRDEAIEQGKEQLNRALRREVLPLKRMLTAEVLIAIARELNLPDVASLYAAVGESQVSAQSIVASLVTAYGGEEGSIDDVTEIVVPWRTVRTLDQDPGVVVVGVSDVWIKLARCCTPVPGDDVFGFVTRSGGVSVHRNDCANAEDLQAQPERIVQVTWKPRAGSTYLVSIQVEALTRDGLLADITNALAIEEVKILSAIVSTTRDGVAVSRFSFEISDTKHLGHLFGAIRKVDGVFDVYRVTS